MKKLLLGLFIWSSSFPIQAQGINTYSIDVHFFPEDAQMWGYAVSNDAFMRGNAKVEWSEINSEELIFYLHGELKIDSIVSGNATIEYDYEKVFYVEDYSRIGLKTSFKSSDVATDKTVNIHYSGFMNPSRARSLSDYMRIDKNDGVYLRSYYYSLWFPVFSTPKQDSYQANFEKITIQLPEKFKCVLTGQQIDERVKDGIYTTTWKPGIVDIADIQCTARAFKLISKDNVLVYSNSDMKNGEKIIDYTHQLKTLFFTNLRSVHDTSSLYIVEMPEYGNISSQNVIGISEDVYNGFDDDLYSKLTIAHELVHPYVAIPISTDNPFFALVVEGFPSFFHLYGLKKILKPESFDLEKFMIRVQENYLHKKQTGKDRRGNQLPPEKPILKISHDEIGTYKERFILPDRVRLFLYHIWTQMGDEKYNQFLKELFQLNSIDYHQFEKLILKYLPNYQDKLSLWLNTIEYPESIHIKE